LVYVRQSSLRQVRTNLESQRRQYEFAEQAAAMGWSRERIVVVDEDQGKSASLAQAREGFARLVSAVARGEVGIVMSLEISRLSRNDADWHHEVDPGLGRERRSRSRRGDARGPGGAGCGVGAPDRPR
jgi:DNA invertase Pin-like site-specific DNA recombinase